MPTVVKYRVPNISCGHCVMKIEHAVGDLDGVVEVHADLRSKTVEVVFDAPTTEDEIVRTLAAIHYPVAERLN